MDNNTCPSPPAPVDYKSDFAFYLDLYAITGYDDEGKPVLEPIGFPDYDWVAKFTTERMSVPFVASSKGGVLTNCRCDNGRILIVANRHNLCPGRLSVDFRADLPSDLYPDGTQLHALPSVLDIELTRHAAPCPSAIEAKLILPYIKGNDAYEYAVEHGYDGTADEFGEALSEVSNKQNKLTASDDFSLTNQGALSLTERAKRAVFDDLWSINVGEFGDIDHSHTEGGAVKPYMLNELWFTYEEALAIHAVSVGKTINAASTRTNSAFSVQFQTRTVYPIFMGHGDVQADFSGICASNYKIEVLRVVATAANNMVKSLHYAFFRCINLRHVYGRLIIPSVVVNKASFESCAKLETLFLKGINRDINLCDCKALSLESVSFMVENRNDSNTITVTVHPDVYAKLTDEANAEWHQVLLDAIAKNISFATV